MNANEVDCELFGGPLDGKRELSEGVAYLLIQSMFGKVMYEFTGETTEGKPALWRYEYQPAGPEGAET